MMLCTRLLNLQYTDNSLEINEKSKHIEELEREKLELQRMIEQDKIIEAKDNFV